MKKTMLRPAAAVVGCVALVVALLLLLPIGKVSASPSTLSACINPGNGNMRLVNSSSDCHANENFVTWNVAGPTGPPGPTGPAGPPGPAAGGPPFIWVCTPASVPKYGATGNFQGLYVFNSSSNTANIAVNILDQSGANLAGVNIPGSQPPTNYPGDSGANTETLDPAHTAFFQWINPVTDPSINVAGVDGHTNVAFVARVTSDQPVVVGMNWFYGNFSPSPCALSPK